MKILKSEGPLIELCGTLIDIDLIFETISLICTNCLRLICSWFCLIICNNFDGCRLILGEIIEDGWKIFGSTKQWKVF